MLEITGKKNLKLVYTDPRPGDIIHSFADISKAKELIGFKPEYDQRTGLKYYFEWYSNKHKVNLNLN